MNPTILVAGFGRCGSSLMMQMLSAGGVPTTGPWPSFEDQQIDAMRSSDPAGWISSVKGKAVKVLDPHRRPIPIGPDYRCIWLMREHPEQARSIAKLIGLPGTRAERKALERSLKRDGPAARHALSRAHAHRHGILNVQFEALILDPMTVAIEIARYLDMDLDVDAMVACVVRRSPICLPYMLEVSLVANPPRRVV